MFGNGMQNDAKFDTVYIVPSVPAPRRPSPTQSVAPFHLRESRQPHYRCLSGPSVPSGFRQTPCQRL